ncbi:bifunctional proline dehydrogenase/L-glutamate gamma-semialdehyde dehydrogenase PutA [Sphingopyxis sp. JAI128]|uniref:bifunctional proline dehydrogenase/L-glutamate gamma-semialdehyde dehydrogenase PutA n=1 Tax=Sphingopyxis sp. JAI128 TaxID=2723066 RepID=UPI001848F882|nr:bifunctional proline dehydrogenase/L-glutamate gamma-semialdehyde dehydrogenase PutA [Sphingopyxis sp. JAI128]MBB6426632.1 RHH-type proline utilization regulon transcriptional repressor/proline dehydrogenase/delta 1-pyrroline-5-carboxylate dehydrogenase [Sphingopyxis sp. JAI128]
MIQSPDRAAIRALARRSEADIVAELRAILATSSASVDAVTRRGLDLIRKAKAEGERETLVAQLMNRYRLSTEEGVVLMCLAEALLRVPDNATANALIRDKIAGRHWTDGEEEDSPLIVALSSRGLSLGSATLMLDAMGSKANPLTLIKSMVRRSGEPVIRQAALAAMKMLGQQFVMGETIDAAVKRANKEKSELASFDMLGEAARTAEDARRYYESYAGAIARIGRDAKPGDPHANHGISIKLSALHPRYEYLQAARVQGELIPHVIELAKAARAVNIPLMIDAEESDRLEPHMDVFAALIDAGIADGWTGLGIVIQAYQKRAPAVIDWLANRARTRGVKLSMRLVKGAYWDTEIKRAQMLGLGDFPVFTAKLHTDLNYMRCAQLLRDCQDCIYPAFASHNAMTLAFVSELFAGADYELQRLHGMGEGAHDALVALFPPPRPVRVYAPVGTHRDLLAYLVRRLLENGANSSFVHQFSDPGVTAEQLAVDPRSVASVASTGIATGLGLFDPVRRNSRGYDLGEPGIPEALVSAIGAARRGDLVAAPIVGGVARSGRAEPVRNPATGAVVGQVVEADAATVADAVAAAGQAQEDWSLAGGAFRAERLERAADLLEERDALFLGLAIDEAGKTLVDAVAEVREAVDFLRYYAAQARADFTYPVALPGPTGERNELMLEGKGVFVAISPWNFPLAIFLGQVSAALAAGNAVLAKPAEQTPLIAHAAVELLLEAGIPGDVLHYLPGRGENVGAALTSHDDIIGVAFTGSTEVARMINRSLAGRDGPIATLIAETGGANAMIVDSTALPEQVARDAVASAFQSAGQRCSALRLLCVQEDVAETMIEMVAGAMAELNVGDPSILATDVGPIIDEEARANIAAYVAEARAAGRVIAEAGRTNLPAEGHFVPPTLIRLDHVTDLKREIFGPVLHVATWKGGELDALIDAINASGYGLTLGVHTRIDGVAAHIAARAQVGNVYVNRNQIGAIVGSQPFGGRGLSGTGPKAGGPHYLHRFAEEKSISTDITAAGGNAALMAG